MTLEEKNEKLLIELGDAVLSLPMSAFTNAKVNELIGDYENPTLTIGVGLEELKEYAKVKHNINTANIFICLEDNGMWSYLVLIGQAKKHKEWELGTCYSTYNAGLRKMVDLLKELKIQPADKQ